ncbi:MAG: folate family ECF transporter S component [Clostridiales bacterium]|jgi:ECF transporter S component (folate family)|nr:folate family ECF transporter S component [Clostridiales bacterium]
MNERNKLTLAHQEIAPCDDFSDNALSEKNSRSAIPFDESDVRQKDKADFFYAAEPQTAAAANQFAPSAKPAPTGAPSAPIGAPSAPTGAPSASIGAHPASIDAPHVPIDAPHASIDAPHAPTGAPHAPTGARSKPTDKKPLRLLSGLSNQKLAYTAVFVALSAVLNSIALVSNAVSALSLTYVVNFFSGVILGPWLGFFVGFTGDLIGCILFPKGPYLVPVGISSGLLGLIPGLIMNLKKADGFYAGLKKPFTQISFKAAQIILTMLIVGAVCTVGINTTTFFLTYSSLPKTFSNFFVYLIGPSRLPVQLPVLIMNTVIIAMTYLSFEGLFKRIKSKIQK